MTWDSFEGERFLTGAGARLFREAFVQMLGYIRSDLMTNEAEHGPQSKSGVAMFDALTNQQRAEIVSDMAIHFLTETPTSLKLTATHEATLYSLLLKIRDEVTMELDVLRLDEGEDDEFDPYANHWRTLVADAYAERLDLESWENGDDTDGSADDEFGILDPDGCDVEIFEEAIESLADKILSDRDFEMEDIFMDASPEESETLRSLMGIGGRFFMETPNDPSTQAAMDLCLRTARMLTRPVFEDPEF